MSDARLCCMGVGALQMLKHYTLLSTKRTSAAGNGVHCDGRGGAPGLLLQCGPPLDHPHLQADHVVRHARVPYIIVPLGLRVQQLLMHGLRHSSEAAIAPAQACHPESA